MCIRDRDYAEQKDGTSSTGLIFSSGSMAHKFGGAFAGWAVMALLAFFGYNTAENAVQTPEALGGAKFAASCRRSRSSIWATVRIVPMVRVRPMRSAV